MKVYQLIYLQILVLMSLMFVSFNCSAFETHVTLKVDQNVSPSADELVTFGLPLPRGEVASISEIRVIKDGREIPAYVEAGLYYHWSDNSLRSVIIQVDKIDMRGGNVVLQLDDQGTKISRLHKRPPAEGWVKAGPAKVNIRYPRIFALHDTQYLADSGLVPPYSPAPLSGDSFSEFQIEQFDDWAGGLNFQESSKANWLFDRSSAMYKAYMTTGDVRFLKEAFLSKQFYFQYVKNEGLKPSPRGGDGCWTYDKVACADGKYIAPQQAKLALALSGDNSQWDKQLIINMALQSDLGWNQFGSRDLFDSENEGFTERGAGLTGLAEIIAYEMTGDAKILHHLNERILSLRDMQQTAKLWDKSNGWIPKSGGWTHNIKVHEGSCSESSCPKGDTNSRAFSPWMSENIVDFLWQTYWITGNKAIPGMLTRIARAVDLYGFTSEFQDDGNYQRKRGFSGHNRTQGCNTKKLETDQLYFASAYADQTRRTTGDWWSWYTDNHNLEIVLILAAGSYFETDKAVKKRLEARINKIIEGWINPKCAHVFSNVYRIWNWQHRSNSIRTWQWIESENR